MFVLLNQFLHHYFFISGLKIGRGSLYNKAVFPKRLDLVTQLLQIGQ